MSIQTVVKESSPLNTSSLINDDTVSVVIPCYNEERFIGKALEQLAGQFPPHRYEIIVVDGLSNDRTRAVIGEFQELHPDLRVSIVDNPARNIPTALNLGVSAAHGNIIARMDAHAVPSSGYIRRCVEVLKDNENGVVGSPCRVRPANESITARAIAIGVSHPFGIGDAKYRLNEDGAGQESVDTVAFSCFHKKLWETLGGFNESLLTNEDYDFNYRVRQSGGTVLLDRAEHCDYFARSTLTSLAHQYWRYGKWKARMLKLHPRSIRIRHIVAPLFVASIPTLVIVGLVQPLIFMLLALEVGVYLSLALWFAWRGSRHTKNAGAVMLVLTLAFLTIHLAWGTSFFVGLLRNSAE